MALLNQKQQLADAKREKEAAETISHGQPSVAWLDETTRRIDEEQTKSPFCLSCGQLLPQQNQPGENLPQ